LFFAALRSHEKVHFEPLALLIYAFLLLGGTWLAIGQGGGLVAIASAAVWLRRVRWASSSGRALRPERRDRPGLDVPSCAVLALLLADRRGTIDT
jgi:hypothetical protein